MKVKFYKKYSSINFEIKGNRELKIIFKKNYFMNKSGKEKKRGFVLGKFKGFCFPNFM